MKYQQPKRGEKFKKGDIILNEHSNIIRLAGNSMEIIIYKNNILFGYFFVESFGENYQGYEKKSYRKAPK